MVVYAIYKVIGNAEGFAELKLMDITADQAEAADRAKDDYYASVKNKISISKIRPILNYMNPSNCFAQMTTRKPILNPYQELEQGFFGGYIISAIGVEEPNKERFIYQVVPGEPDVIELFCSVKDRISENSWIEYCKKHYGSRDIESFDTIEEGEFEVVVLDKNVGKVANRWTLSTIIK
jgi:hypothetical protein